MIDVHNPADTIEIQTYHKPSNCTVLSKKGDYIKYHYNATLMDGTKLDSTVLGRAVAILSCYAPSCLKMTRFQHRQHQRSRKVDVLVRDPSSEMGKGVQMLYETDSESTHGLAEVEEATSEAMDT
eukprot:g42926.t1